MTVKYKVSDFAKDLNISAKKVLDELAAMGSTGKKNSSTLEENELNYLLEKFSKDNSEADLSAYLNSARQPAPEKKAEQPRKAEKKAEPKAEKPAAQSAQPAKKAEPQNNQNSQNQKNKKNEQHTKREERLFL